MSCVELRRPLRVVEASARADRCGSGARRGRGLVVGFFWSTVLVYHATFCINSLAHVRGRRRYVTADDSRNNWLLAVFTMGEGWHNNHHAYQSSVRQGFRWWEIDPTFYILKVLSWFALVWDLKTPPVLVPLYPLARGCRAPRRIMPELEATAPPIPFWCYRVSGGGRRGRAMGSASPTAGLQHPGEGVSAVCSL